MPVKNINIPFNSECATIAQGKDALEHLSGLFECVEKYEATQEEDEKGRQYLMITNQVLAVYDYWKNNYPRN